MQARKEEIRALRAECRELEADIFEKEGQQDALLAELEGAPKGAPGAAYVRRISDIVKQVRKQDADIAKVSDSIAEKGERGKQMHIRFLRIGKRRAIQENRQKSSGRSFLGHGWMQHAAPEALHLGFPNAGRRN